MPKRSYTKTISRPPQHHLLGIPLFHRESARGTRFSRRLPAVGNIDQSRAPPKTSLVSRRCSELLNIHLLALPE